MNAAASSGFGSRLRNCETPEPSRVVPLDQRRLAEHPAAAPLLPGPVPDRGGHLARRDRREQPPEVVAVDQLGELAAAGTLAEAVECAQRDVLLVELPPRARRELCPCEPDQPEEIAVPEPLDVGVVARPGDRRASGKPRRLRPRRELRPKASIELNKKILYA